MGKITDNIKNGILTKNWNLICDSYFRLTGEKVEVPEDTAPATVIDPFTMNKKDLYKYLTVDLECRLGPMKSYQLDDLKVILTASLETDEPKLVAANKINESENASTSPEFTYVPPQKKDRVLNMDKKRLPVNLNDFPSYGDEGKSKVERNRASAAAIKVNATCIRCKKSAAVNPAIIIKGVDNNEKNYICEKCS